MNFPQSRGSVPRKRGKGKGEEARRCTYDMVLAKEVKALTVINEKADQIFLLGQKRLISKI